MKRPKVAGHHIAPRPQAEAEYAWCDTSMETAASAPRYRGEMARYRIKQREKKPPAVNRRPQASAHGTRLSGWPYHVIASRQPLAKSLTPLSTASWPPGATSFTLIAQSSAKRSTISLRVMWARQARDAAFSKMVGGCSTSHQSSRQSADALKWPTTPAAMAGW